MKTPDKHDAASDDAMDTQLRGLHSDLLSDSLPPTLRRAAERAEAKHRKAASQRQWVSVAAAVLVAFGVGWLGHGQWAGTAYAQRHNGLRDFVRQASYAYTVYQPEQRHPVEVAAAEQEHLVQWLSKRLDRPLKIPHLEPQGFTLVGGRLLPGDSGARAQFMFQNPEGQRITLYLGALDKGVAAYATQEAQSTQFRFETQGAVSSFYWVELGFGYALSGPVDRATLMDLANSVYTQLN